MHNTKQNINCTFLLAAEVAALLSLPIFPADLPAAALEDLDTLAVSVSSVSVLNISGLEEPLSACLEDLQDFCGKLDRACSNTFIMRSFDVGCRIKSTCCQSECL